MATAAVASIAIVTAAAIALEQARVAAGQRARAEERLAAVRRLANSFMFEFHDAMVCPAATGIVEGRNLRISLSA